MVKIIEKHNLSHMLCLLLTFFILSTINIERELIAKEIKIKQLLKFDKYCITVETFENASDTTVYYTFINHSGTDIRLTGISVSCRCIKVNYDKKDIKPGERSMIAVSFRPKGYNTMITRKIVVYSTLSKSCYSAILELRVIKNTSVKHDIIFIRK